MVRKTVKWFWRIYLTSLVGFVGLLVAINFEACGEMPSLEELENPSKLQASEVYANDGTPMGKYFIENRSIVEYKDISPYAKYALVATEDERFFEHSGIDGRSLARAAVGVLTFNSKGGASTITQQLSLALLHERKRNKFERAKQKLQEWIVSVKLEKNFTKEEILSLYFNQVTYPDNVYGIRNASLTFFQKEPDRLKPEEAALLVGSLNAITTYNPRLHPKAAITRRNFVIDKMVKNADVAQYFGIKGLTQADANRLKSLPMALSYKPIIEETYVAPYFKDVVREEMKKWCKTHKKPNGQNYNLYKDGLKVYTTIDPKMQQLAEESAEEHLRIVQRQLYGSIGRSGWVFNKHQRTIDSAIRRSQRWQDMKDQGYNEQQILQAFNTKTKMRIFYWNNKHYVDTNMTPIDSIKHHRTIVQTGFMVMEPGSGLVKAWVGGSDYKTFKYDHVNTNTKRQVGSTIKPLLYVQAMKELNMSPNTIIQNRSQRFENFGWYPSIKAYGDIAMRDALAASQNGAAAYLIKQVGVPKFMEWLKQLNITSDLKPYPSLCLGAFEISLQEMMATYTMFPNKGFQTKPILIAKICDNNGNVIQDFEAERSIMISEIDAYNMVQMMKGVCVRGTGKAIGRYYGGEIAGKTGTTNDNSDCWFMGYTPQLLGGVWVGCDDRFIRIADNDAMGSTIAMPIFGRFLNKVYNDKKLSTVYQKAVKFEQPAETSQQAIYDYDPLNNIIPVDIDYSAMDNSDNILERKATKNEYIEEEDNGGSGRRNSNDSSGNKGEDEGVMQKPPDSLFLPKPSAKPLLR
jgi:penicillin-binding protein 1A